MPGEDRVAEVRARLDYVTLFEELTVDRGGMRGHGRERTARCFVHDDTNPSMSINVEEGLWFCHACQARGDVFDAMQRLRGQSFPEALEELARRAGVDLGRTGPRREPPTPEREAEVLAAYQRRMNEGDVEAPAEVDRVIDESVVEAAAYRLVNTPVMLQKLQERRKLTLETIERFQLGYDGKRVYIPVRNADGAVVNIRQYKFDGSGPDKMISWRSGFGTARIFPLANVEVPGPIYLMEGEMDCLLANQEGLNAITTTGGAGTWRDTWNVMFADRDVVICYDCDEAGRNGARHIARQLHANGARVKIVNLGLHEPPGADFTDYIGHHGHTVFDFKQLVQQAQDYVNDDVAVVIPSEPEGMHLSKASNAEYWNQPVRFDAMVSGKTTLPYIVPQKLEMRCSTPGAPMCASCPLDSRGGHLLREVAYTDNEVIGFTDIPDPQVFKQAKAMFRIPSRCNFVAMTVVETVNVEKVQLIPAVTRTEAAAPYVTREAYYVGNDLRANQTYSFVGITTTDPKRQSVTHLLHTAHASQTNIEAFTLTDDVIQRLKVFQPTKPGVKGLQQHLAAIYDDLERVTRIYQRRDLMLAVDLTFHSVVAFSLQGELLTRGWCDTLVIGDSRTGKSTAVERITRHYGAGELSTGENTSAAGLVGGLHQVGTTWALLWGKIPLNDRRLVVIDEAGNMQQEQIGRMSAMRSSGVAEIVKVHTEKTHARTRQIWISNPRSPRPLSTFSQGVQAVKELIGAPEDIARFDMVVTAATDDVELTVINATRPMELPDVFSADVCHQRVMWAWSRSSEQVVWGPGALEELLKVAMIQGQKYRYTTEIPIVEPNEQRVKLARLSVAAAAMFFSCDETGRTLIVKPEHVEFVHEFLERLYSKPSLNFTEYAEMARRRQEVDNPLGVRNILGRRPRIMEQMLEQEQFTQSDLSELLGYEERSDLREAISLLRDCNFLRRRGSSFYFKTAGAIAWLRRELRGSENGLFESEPEEEEMVTVGRSPAAVEVVPPF